MLASPKSWLVDRSCCSLTAGAISWRILAAHSEHQIVYLGSKYPLHAMVGGATAHCLALLHREKTPARIGKVLN